MDIDHAKHLKIIVNTSGINPPIKADMRVIYLDNRAIN